MNSGLLYFPEGRKPAPAFANRLELTASTSWSCPPDIVYARVTVIGGGGGGGNDTAPNDWKGGGGGAGEYAQSILQVQPGWTYVVTVGAGGAMDNPGTDSSFGDNLVLAKAGGAGAAAAAGAGGAGGVGGTGGVGDILSRGNDGST